MAQLTLVEKKIKDNLEKSRKYNLKYLCLNYVLFEIKIMFLSNKMNALY